MPASDPLLKSMGTAGLVVYVSYHRPPVNNVTAATWSSTINIHMGKPLV